MALSKTIRQSDGVTTTYHRILYYQTTVNRQNSIVVLSYVDKQARNIEKNLMDIDQPYKKCITYETDYDPNMTIESAYEYLMTLPEFSKATYV